MTYNWASTGAKISGTGTTATVDTTGLAPGMYTVSGTATDAKEKKNNIASCKASFTVKTPHPPVASCSSSPHGEVGRCLYRDGERQQSGQFPLTYAWTATAGHISGNGASATVDTTGAPQGSPITATATVTDSRGLSTSCTATVKFLRPR